MQTFKNKVAVITGAASGIGLATAKLFLRQGMHVVLMDNRQDALDQAKLSLSEISGKKLFLTVDVRDADAVETAAEQVIAEFGGVHLLVNNAAVFIRGPDIVDVGDDIWDWILDVNLYGTIHCIRSFLPRIQAHGEEGHIINTCSLSGFTVRDRKNGVYATSKFALVGLSEALAHDLAGTSVGVSVVLPAAVATDFYLTSAQHRGEMGGNNTVDQTPEDTANGMSPDEVAARLLDGIRHRRFYIATHTQTRAMLEARHQQLMAAYDAAEKFIPDQAQP